MAKTEVVTEQEAKQKRGELIVMIALIVGGIAILVGMGLISAFLSNDQKEARTPLLIGFGSLAVVTAGLYLWGRQMQKA